MKKLLYTSLLSGLILTGFNGLEPNLFITSVQAEQEWVLLGERTVGDNLDHDTIVVTALRGDFRKIQFKVKRHAIKILHLVVHYGNGSSDKIETREIIPAGGESRVIDLRGGDRVIKKIDFWYETKSLGRERAEIRVFGRR